MKCLGLVILICSLILMAEIIFVALLLTTFYIKKKFHKMDELKWDFYFKSMSNSGYILRFWILYLISIMLVSIVGYYVFSYFAFESAMFLSIIVFALGMIEISFKFKKVKKKLIEKLNKFRNI